jgi:hypothetical protein
MKGLNGGWSACGGIEAHLRRKKKKFLILEGELKLEIPKTKK